MFVHKHRGGKYIFVHDTATDVAMREYSCDNFREPLKGDKPFVFVTCHVSFRVHLREDSPCGTTVVKIATPELAMEDYRNVMFSIFDGNTGGTFQIMR